MDKAGTLSYCELRAKEVINVIDGRRLGRVLDVVFTAGHDCAEVRGIVVPYVRRLFFSRSQEVFVPWQCIRKIGEDVILIDLVLDGHGGHGNGKKRRRYDAFEDGRFDDCDDDCTKRGGNEGHEGHGGKKSYYSVHTDSVKEKEKESSSKAEAPSCDRKCEKCMLFDCAYRWKDME